MKKYYCVLFTALAALFFLTGCGSAKTVPEQTLNWAVEDCLSMYSYYGGDYTDYQSEITHSPDAETNTDTVHIDLTITYPHLTAAIGYDATYQYDKSTDIWSVIRGGYWDEFHVQRYDMTSSSRLWLEALQEAGFTATILAEGKDATADAASLSDYPELSGAVANGWEIIGESSDSWAEIDAFCLEMQDVQDACKLYETAQSEYMLGSNRYEDYSTDGENYTYALYSDYDSTEYISLIRIDNTVFLLDVYDDQEAYYDSHQILAQVGFIP